MVKRATIHVSSRTKKESSENEGIREVKKDNKYNLYYILQPSYPFRKAGCNIVLAKLLFWLFTLQKDCIHA